MAIKREMGHLFKIFSRDCEWHLLCRSSYIKPGLRARTSRDQLGLRKEESHILPGDGRHTAAFKTRVDLQGNGISWQLRSPFL